MQHHDTIIVGAGPAGLQMGYFLEQAGRDYLILEATADAGAFFTQQPRHRTLISLNKRFNYFPEPEFNMRHDWNSLLTEEYDFLFRDYSKELYPHAEDIVRYLNDFAEKYALQLMLPTLRADFQLAESYQYSEDARLACPITVFGGREDAHATAEQLDGWRQQTDQSFHIHFFEGGHFFLHSAERALLQTIAQTLVTQREPELA